MDKFIVYVDDAAHAMELAPALFTQPQHAQGHWVLVACAPRMTHRVSKWVSHSSREQWRDKWADKLFSQIVPAWRPCVGQLNWVLAKGPVNDVTENLLREGPAELIDLRKPRASESSARSDNHGRADWRLLVATTMGWLAVAQD